VNPRAALVRAFRGLWWTVGLVVFYLSVTTVRTAMRGGHDSGGPHAILVGGVEAIAAILFLIPRTMSWGGAGLLATFVVAFLFHAHAGHFAAPILVYAAAVLFVMVHGPVPRNDPGPSATP
jgi:hypothetical protein